jgi:hypothetical protein
MLAEIGWPSIGTSDWLSQADWPSVGVGNLLGQIGWPSIPGSGLLGEVSWPQVGAGLLLGVVSWPTIGVSALLSRPSWPSIGTNSLIGEVGWPSITAGSIVGSIDWPTIDASAITSRFGNNTDNNDSDSGLLPFANGGVVTGPTNALIGEAGPEAVIPLDRLNEVMGSQQGASNAQSSARGQATSEDIRRLEDQLRTVVSELQNMGGDIVLQVGQRELGAASTESTQKFQRAREVTK